MANRAVVVDLIVRTSQFTAGMRRASHDMASETTNMETKTKALQMQIGLLGVGMVAFAAVAVQKWAQFDQAMARVSATGGEASKRIDELNDAAKSDDVIQLGYNAVEASNSIYELVKAGVSAQDIIGGGMAGALSLAAAETMDASDAALIMASALTQFNLAGDKSAHVADLIVAGAGKAQGSAHDLGLALKQSGLVADQFGLSIEETTGTLAFFASAGLIGSDAGTSLRTMLLHLAGPSTKAANLMKTIGLEIYGSNGQMVDMETLANNLQSSMGKLSEEQRNQALATIFGADATRAAALLYREGGDKVVEWTEKVNDAGYAQEVARKRMDNLNGDIKKLSATWDRSMISMGESADAPLRSLVTGITSLIDWFGELDPAIQGVIMALTGGGGLVILATLGIAQVVTAITTLQAGLVATGVLSQATAAKMATAFGVAARALGIIGVVAGASFALMTTLANATKISVDDLAASYDVAAGKFSDGATEIAANKIADSFNWTKKLQTGFSSIADAARYLKVPLDDLAQAMIGNEEAAKRVQAVSGVFDLSDKELAAGGKKVDLLNDTADALGVSATKGHDAARLLNETIGKNGEVTDEAIQKANDLSEAQGGTGAASEGLQGQVESLDGALGTLGETTTAVTAEEVAAQKAHEEYVSAIVDSFTSFFGLGDVYQGVIDGQKEVATAAAESSESTKDSWEDFYDGSSVSADQYIAELGRQVAAQEAWAANLLALTGRVKTEMPADLQVAAQEMITELRGLGPEGAAQIALLQSMSATELQAVVDLFRRQGAATGQGWADEVEAAETPEVEVDTVKAAADVARIHSLLTGLPSPSVLVNVDTTAATQKVLSLRSLLSLPGTAVPFPMQVPKKATGGALVGPGTGTSDSMLAAVSNGEHVLTASDVQKAGGQDAIYRMRNAIQSGMLKFAGGGAVNGSQVNAWYQRYLGRGAAPSEQAWWTQQDPDSVESGIRDSVEALTQSIRGWYQDYLKRPASDQEAASWAGAGIGASDVQWLIQNSPEAKNTALAGTRSDVTSGEFREDLTGGKSGALSAIDKVRNDVLPSLTGAAADALANALNKAEAAAGGLYDQVDAVDTALDSATDKAKELQGISEGVQNNLAGGFDLGQITQTGTVNPFTGQVTGGGPGSQGQGMLASAQAYAAKVKTFAGKLQRLADRGFAGVILQEIAAMGADAGIPAADALLSLDPGDTSALNQAYTDIATFGGQAGQAVTEGFYQGGLAAADGLVAGLEAQKGKVQQAIMDMALAMQEALAKALDMHSPSRKFRAMMNFVGQGTVLGLEDQQGIVADATARMFSGVTVPGGGGFYGGAGSGSGSSGDLTASLSDQQIERLAVAFETGNVRNINSATAQKNRKMELTYGARGR